MKSDLRSEPLGRPWEDFLDCERQALGQWAPLFRPLPTDLHPLAFAQDCQERAHGRLREGLRQALRRIVSDFDADALLGTCPMALLGEASWRDLCDLDPERENELLDVGAGSGDITVEARTLFSRITTLEVSGPLVRRLRARGLRCLQHDLSASPYPGEERFDVVSMLNVLDRTMHPLALLKSAQQSLVPGGALLLSVPLPVDPHVDLGGHTVDPDQPLGGHGATFEQALVDLIEGTLLPAGLNITRLARTPYLCRGDKGTPLHRLDAVLVVARAL